MCMRLRGSDRRASPLRPVRRQQAQVRIDHCDGLVHGSQSGIRQLQIEGRKGRWTRDASSCVMCCATFLPEAPTRLTTHDKHQLTCTVTPKME